MALVETLQDVVDQLDEATDEQKRSLIIAMAVQYQSVLRDFCFENDLQEDWRNCLRALFPGKQDGKIDLKEALQSLFDRHMDDMEESGLPVFVPVAIASSALEPIDSGFPNATGAFFHEFGHSNSLLVHGTHDFNWIDLGLPLHPTVKLYLAHYVDFIDGKIDDFELSVLSALYDVRRLLDKLPQFEPDDD